MATINQIQKQIETANRNIEKFEKKIAMYSTRLDKAVAALNKTGVDFSVDQLVYNERFRDYSMPASMYDTIDYEIGFRITNNMNYLSENKRDLEREIKRRDNLSETLANMIADAKQYETATAGLKQALETAMAEFRVTWFERMREWYGNHYDHVRALYPERVARRGRAMRCKSYFSERRDFFIRTRTYYYLRKVIMGCDEIICDRANRMDKPEYMERIERELTDSWNAGIKVLTDKCHVFGLDESKIVVSHPEMTSKGFSAIIRDNDTRVVDVRVIWAAEYSVLVSPHTRYIATQRTK